MLKQGWFTFRSHLHGNGKSKVSGKVVSKEGWSLVRVVFTVLFTVLFIPSVQQRTTRNVVSVSRR